MVQGKWFPMGSDLSRPLALRQQIFGRGRDELDGAAQQVVVYRDDVPVGTARLWWQDGTFRLGSLGVLESERGKGFGDLLVRLVLFKALTHQVARIELTSPRNVAAFFTQYGFQPMGDRAGPETDMFILGKDVQLSHCGGQCDTCEHRTEECIPKALR